jgi:1-acyl-sn-glycerol-3-phosphate acyltransferase
MFSTAMRIRDFFVLFLVKTLVFRKVSLFGAPLPEKGAPVLYLGFHRNGAVDGWAYAIALSRPVEFMVASQLLKNPVARFFFWGVEVTRRGDEGSPASNRRGLDLAVSLLVQSNPLFIFPEGTSTLGPRHLEFMKGSALVASRAFKQRPDLRVVPLSIRYGSPTLWGGDVEVTSGRALSSKDFEDPFDAKNLHRTFTEVLDSLAPCFVSEEEMEDATQAASLVSPFLPYSEAIRLAAEFSWKETDAGNLWLTYKKESTACKKWRGMAVFPYGGALCEALKFLLSGAVVLSAIFFNALPVVAGAWAGRRFPDGPNVVLLWKSLAGLTVFLVYTPLLWGCFFALDLGWLAVAHLFVTVLGCKLLETYRKSSASLWNFMFHRNLREKFERVKEAIRDEFMARFLDS